MFFSLVTVFTDLPSGTYPELQGRRLPGSQWNDPSPLIKYLFMLVSKPIPSGAHSCCFGLVIEKRSASG